MKFNILKTLIYKTKLSFKILVFLIFAMNLYCENLKFAPEFTFKGLKNKKTSFKKFSNNSLTMILFWNHCCAKDELPKINDLFLKYKNENLKFLAISLDRGSKISSAKNYYKREKIAGELFFDTDGKVYRKFHGTFTKPVFFIIGKDNKIVFRYDGHASKEFYEKTLKKYLNL